MAQGPTGGSAADASELERLRKKLDGFEAMGLQVGPLRALLERDPQAFKATYMDEIRRQLDGATPGPVGGATPPVEEVEVSVTTPSDAVAAQLADEELEAELELGLEGAGPEEALTGVPPSAELPLETTVGAMTTVPRQAASRVTAPLGEPKVEKAEASSGSSQQDESSIGHAALEEYPAHLGLVADVDHHDGPFGLGDQGPGGEEGPGLAELDIGTADLEEGVEAIEVVATPPEDGILEASAVEPEDGLEDEVGKDIDEVLDEVQEGQDDIMEMLDTHVSTGAGLEEGGELPPEEAPEGTGHEDGDEAEAEADAEAEPEAEAPAKLKPRRPPRRRPGKVVMTVMVAALVVVSGLGLYFVFAQNTPPVASFTYGPEEPIAGAQVTFDASRSSDPDKGGISQYRWSFGDGTTGKGRVVKHTYNSTGDLMVELTVEDAKGATARSRQTVTVSPLVVTMAPPMIGDIHAYDVVAYLDVFNPEGLARYEFSLGPSLPSYIVVVKEVRARLAGEKTVSVDGSGTSEDGFMASHDVRFETTDYNLDDVEGEVLTNQATDIGLGGSVRLIMHDSLCNQWDRSVRTDVELQARFTVDPDFLVTETDTGTFYNALDDIGTSFSLNSFLRSTRFASEDVTEHQLVVGSGTYLWRVRGMERVEGRTAWGLHVNITMSPDTLRDAGLDAFYTDVWLEPGLSMPAKSHVHTKAYSAGTAVILDITETMTSSVPGSQAPSMACSANHAFSIEEAFSVDFTALGLVPVQGGVGGDFAFTPEDALATARQQMPDFDQWLSQRPQAFCHDGNYTEVGGEPRWSLSFGTGGSSEHYRITVVQTVTARAASGGSYVDTESPRGSRSGAGTVVTLSRGMRLLRNQTEVQEKAYIDGNPDWERFNLTLGEGVQSLPLSPTSMGAQGGAGYVYVLESHDGATSAKGRYRAGLDATNGQVLFSWTQKQATTGTISNR